MSRANSWKILVVAAYNLAATLFRSHLRFLRELNFDRLRHYVNHYPGLVISSGNDSDRPQRPLRPPPTSTTSTNSAASSTTPAPGKRSIHKIYVVARAREPTEDYPGGVRGIYYNFLHYADQVRDPAHYFGGRKIEFAPGTVSQSFAVRDRDLAYQFFEGETGLRALDHLYGWDEPVSRGTA